MPNVTNQKGVLILDTAADNIVAAGTPVRVRKVRFVHPTAAGSATITDAGGSQAKIELSALAGGSDYDEFIQKAFQLDGLKVIALAAGGTLYIYTE